MTPSAPVVWVTVSTNHELRLYNSLGRRMEDFVPAAEVAGLYSCGPTVYAYPHLGNMRAYVFADTLRRALRWKEIPVRHVVNITDVGHAVADTETGEDKLEVAAARERRSVLDIAAYYTDVFLVDTARDPHYGELAQMSTEGQLEAARLEHVEGRRRKTDFALWRAEEPGQRRVLRWESPWGWGAPGWHLECSVMSMALLGQHFDLHTGGVDHRELHHVNEIAQSQAFLGDGKPWVRYWLHGEFLQLGAEKMAKSAGGAPRLADLTEAGYHPMAYRLFLLGGHYRSQLDFNPSSTAAIDAAQATLRRLVARVQPLRPLPPVETLADARQRTEGDPAAQRLLDTIDAAIAADLSTPKILAALQDALREPALTPDGQRAVVAAADALLGLGLASLDPADLEHRRALTDLSDEEKRAIEELVADRTQARKERDWARADQIRAQLDELGVELTDTPEGPVWQLR